jgi:hypothetical protein
MIQISFSWRHTMNAETRPSRSSTFLIESAGDSVRHLYVKSGSDRTSPDHRGSKLTWGRSDTVRTATREIMMGH